MKILCLSVKNIVQTGCVNSQYNAYNHSSKTNKATTTKHLIYSYFTTNFIKTRKNYKQNFHANNLIITDSLSLTNNKLKIKLFNSKKSYKKSHRIPLQYCMPY